MHEINPLNSLCIIPTNAHDKRSRRFIIFSFNCIKFGTILLSVKLSGSSNFDMDNNRNDGAT